MPKANRLLAARDAIASHFSKAPQKVYSTEELAGVLFLNYRSWHLLAYTTTANFIAFLVKHGVLSVCKFRSRAYQKEIVRYASGTPSPHELAISLKPRGYFCHATAVTLHGLATLSSKTIYLNSEQSPKPTYPESLTQGGIDRAFAGNQRQSKLIYKFDGNSVVMISGKNTDRAGVEEITVPSARTVPVTGIERTIIDITVRPAYAGGVSQVLRAYRAAQDRISAERLVAILQELEYVYPYHQSIGFLMERAGYPQKDYDRLRKLGLHYDFYLAYGMKQRDYSTSWRLHYPKGFRA